ncbi:MAG: hypothetical protein Q9220_005488 [cf. Caloplaca sp. 1 TL-2023]
MSTMKMKYQTFLPGSLHALAFDIYTMWLFTFSDLKTIVGPKTAFGVCSALCADIFQLPSKPSQVIIWRTPIVALWVWINLLPFAISNQRQPAAIVEDAINKPWRPMPSHRLTMAQAKRRMLGLYAIAIGISLYVGALRQCVVLIFLGYWYNDLGGADKNPLIRNLINGCGFVCYTSGAMEVAYGEGLQLAADGLLTRWLGLIGAVVTSSVHTQDMYDKAGDSIRGRRTVPLVIGDWWSRLSIAAAIFVWSYLGLRFWNADRLQCAPVLALGLVVIRRTLTLKNVDQDRTTFKVWNAWIVALYTLPLMKSIKRVQNRPL